LEYDLTNGKLIDACNCGGDADECKDADRTLWLSDEHCGMNVAQPYAA
jgi:hypothetical protein